MTLTYPILFMVPVIMSLFYRFDSYFKRKLYLVSLYCLNVIVVRRATESKFCFVYSFFLLNLAMESTQVESSTSSPNNKMLEYNFSYYYVSFTVMLTVFLKSQTYNTLSSLRGFLVYAF